MKKYISILTTSLILASSSVFADDDDDARAICQDVPTHEQLKTALDASGYNSNGGFNLHMWGTIVNRDGFVCAVAFTGTERGDQWPGSRVISAAKAYTANAYSLEGYALSTANLYASGQPGGSLWGLQFSNPTDTKAAYRGNPENYGQPNDPMVGRKVGGQIVFGGGFALYNSDGEIVGGLGVSGDTSCKDHNFGWKVRDNLNLDYVPNGPSGAGDDNIIYDMIGGDIDFLASHDNTISPSAFGHVDCDLGESGILLPPVKKNEL